MILVGARHGDLGWCDRAARVVVVQPEAGLARQLSRQVAGRAGVSLHPVALGRKAARAELRVRNLEGMSSLHPVTDEMRALLPGLRETARQEVRKIAVAELLDEAGPLPDPVRLRLSAPGDEAEILEGLAEAGLLERLAELTLRCSEAVLHEGGEPRSALEARLLDAGFALAGADTSDPDWPMLTFRPDRTSRALREAQERNAQLEASKAGLETRIAELEAALAAAEGERQALEAQLKEVSDKAAVRQDRIAGLEKAAEAARQEAEARDAAARDRGAALAAAAAAADSERRTLEAQLKEISEKAEWRHGRIAELEAAAAKAKQELEAARRDGQDTRKRLDELTHRLQLARDDLRRSEGQIELIKDLLLRGETL